VQQDFKPRGLKHWFKDVLRVGIVGSCLLSLCFAKMETVPYTKRPHLILINIESHGEVVWGDYV
jgi:hypothetical protein